MKMYLNKNQLIGNEKETMKVSLQTCLERFINDMFLFNKAIKYDNDLLFNIVVGNKEVEYDDIYQYYLTDLSEWDIERFQNLEKQLNDEGKEFPLIIADSEELDCYVLLMDVIGMSWSYCPTDINITFDYDEADI